MKNLLLFSVIVLSLTFIISINSKAQWQQCNGIYGGYLFSLIISGNNIFAGTDANGVYLSTNNGANWTQTALDSLRVYSLTV